MNKTKETVIAVTFIIAVALLYAGINFLKGKNLLSKSNVYYACYHDVTGLSDTSPIYTNGVRIGIVDGISYDYQHPDEIVVRLKINKKLPVPAGSVAILETELLGSVSMNLVLADDHTHILMPGDTLIGSTNRGTLSQISELMPRIYALLPTLDSILTSVQAITADSSIIRTLRNTEALTADADKALTHIRSLTPQATELIDKLNSTADNLNTITRQLTDATSAADISALTQQLSTTINDLSSAAAGLNSKEGTAGLLLTDPTLFENLNKVCTDAQTLINDIREHPSHYIRLWK